MKYVLDACAVIAYVRDELGGELVEDYVGRQSSNIAIHAVNLLEVYYKLATFGGEAAANDVMRDMAALGIKVYDQLDEPLRMRAGFFKLRYSFLSLADTVCIAYAEHIGATVVTSDRPFSNITDDVDILLIR